METHHKFPHPRLRVLPLHMHPAALLSPLVVVGRSSRSGVARLLGWLEHELLHAIVSELPGSRAHGHEVSGMDLGTKF